MLLIAFLQLILNVNYVNTNYSLASIIYPVCESPLRGGGMRQELLSLTIQDSTLLLFQIFSAPKYAPIQPAIEDL